MNDHCLNFVAYLTGFTNFIIVKEWWEGMDKLVEWLGEGMGGRDNNMGTTQTLQG